MSFPRGSISLQGLKWQIWRIKLDMAERPDRMTNPSI